MRQLFWFLTAASLVFVGLAAAGYAVMPIVALLILIDLVTAWTTWNSDRLKIAEMVKNDIAARISHLENNLTTSVAAFDSKVSGEYLESRLNEHKEQIFNQMNDTWDRVAKKAVDIENRMNEFRRIVGTVSGSFDERLKSLEAETETRFETVELPPE
jgi:hypothetical protein